MPETDAAWRRTSRVRQLLGAQTERPRPVASANPEGQVRVAHTERAELLRIEELTWPTRPRRGLRARGYHLRRPGCKRAGSDCGGGRRAGGVNEDDSKNSHWLDEFWSREAEAQMVDHLAKRPWAHGAEAEQAAAVQAGRAEARERDAPEASDRGKIDRRRREPAAVRAPQSEPQADPERATARAGAPEQNLATPGDGEPKRCGGPSSTRAFSTAATPRPPRRHTDRPSVRRPAKEPVQPHGSQHLSVAATVDTHDTHTHRVAAPVEEVH